MTNDTHNAAHTIMPALTYTSMPQLEYSEQRRKLYSCLEEDEEDKGMHMLVIVLAMAFGFLFGGVTMFLLLV